MITMLSVLLVDNRILLETPIFIAPNAVLGDFVELAFQKELYLTDVTRRNAVNARAAL